jgi:hypothetical protein
VNLLYFDISPHVLEGLSMIITALQALHFKQQGHVQILKGGGGEIVKIIQTSLRYPDPLGGCFLSQRDFS